MVGTGERQSLGSPFPFCLILLHEIFGCTPSLLRLGLDSSAESDKTRSWLISVDRSPHRLVSPPLLTHLLRSRGVCCRQRAQGRLPSFLGGRGKSAEKTHPPCPLGWVEHLGSPKQQRTVVKARRKVFWSKAQSKKLF